MHSPRNGFGRLILLLVPALLGSASVYGQAPPVIEDVDTMMERAAESGTAGREFDMASDIRGVFNLDSAMPTTETGERVETMILIYEGYQIFCSVPFCAFNPRSENFARPLADYTRYRWVSMGESTTYFDDGPAGGHGDVLANDGLPSRVQVFDTEYICPYCYRNMLYLEDLRNRAEWQDFWAARVQSRTPLIKEKPTTFYTSLKITTVDPEDPAPKDPDPMANYYDKEAQHQQFLDRFESEILGLYRKPTSDGRWIDYQLHRDDSRLPPPSIPAPPTAQPPGPGGPAGPAGPGVGPGTGMPPEGYESYYGPPGQGYPPPY